MRISYRVTSVGILVVSATVFLMHGSRPVSATGFDSCAMVETQTGWLVLLSAFVWIVTFLPLLVQGLRNRTLPRLIGEQQAAMLLYTGRRLTGEEALAIGLADYCVPLDQVRAKAVEVATEIGQSAPLAIIATRETLRRGLAEAVARATEREYEEQDWLRNTADFKEGTKAMGERRPPNFLAR